MRWRLVLLGILILFTCVSTNAADSPIEDTNYCQLAKNPQLLAGKRIRIRAVYSYMFEVSHLIPMTCCTGVDVPIWVDFSEDLDHRSRRLFDHFPKGSGFVLAVFVGTFEGGKVFGPFGERFRINVDKIEAVEQQANAIDGKSPTWASRNCTDTKPAKDEKGGAAHNVP